MNLNSINLIPAPRDGTTSGYVTYLFRYWLPDDSQHTINVTCTIPSNDHHDLAVLDPIFIINNVVGTIPADINLPNLFTSFIFEDIAATLPRREGNNTTIIIRGVRFDLIRNRTTRIGDTYTFRMSGFDAFINFVTNPVHDGTLTFTEPIPFIIGGIRTRLALRQLTPFKSVKSVPMRVHPDAYLDMFRRTSVRSVDGLSKWDVHGVMSLNDLFYGCRELSNIDGIANWDVSCVVRMDNMFNGCDSLINIDGLSNWNVSNLRNVQSMFASCVGLIDIDALRMWTPTLTVMREMFMNCTRLTSLEGLRNWDVSKVEDMSNVFANCNGFTSVNDLVGWNVSGVTNMSAMMIGCEGLRDIMGLRDWNVSKVTNMSNMFDRCPLQSLDGLEGWNVSKVTNMDRMFAKTEISNMRALSGWNVRNVMNMSSMFMKAEMLMTLDGLDEWDVSNVKEMNGMFEGCVMLEDIEGVKNWNVRGVRGMRRMFACSEITLEKLVTTLSKWTVNEIDVYSFASNVSERYRYMNWKALGSVGIGMIAELYEMVTRDRK